MKHAKNAARLSILGLICGGLSACGNGDAGDDRSVICLHQNTSAAPSEAVIIGMQEAIEADGRYDVDVKNSEGDAAAALTITEQFLRGDCAAIAPAATALALGYVNREKEVPIVFAGIAEPFKLGVVTGTTDPGRNVTGIAAPIPIADEIDLMLQVDPTADKLGIIFGAADLLGQSNAEVAKEHCAEINLDCEQIGVANSGAIKGAADLLISQGVDAIQVACDSATAPGVPAMLKAGNEVGVPVFGCSDVALQDGKLFAGGYSYEDLGEAAAEVILRVADGEDPGSIPVTYYPLAGYFVNLDAARDFGLEFPSDIVEASPQVVGAPS